MHSSVGMKFVIQYSCVSLLILFSCSPKKTQSSNLSVSFDAAYLENFVHLDLWKDNHQFLSLALDTANGLTMTNKCNQSTLGSSYSPIRCNATECFEFWVERGQLLNTTQMCALNSTTCDYHLHENMYNGTLSKVNLNGFPDFVFGCGHTAEGDPPRFGYSVDGVLGLGRGGALSFLPQTNSTRFSYCLPSTSTSTGYFTFNNNTHDQDDNNNDDALLSFTPFIQPRPGSNYVVDTVTITVGGTQLPIAYQNILGTVIDTGLKITQLPTTAYIMMRDEFRRQIGTNYRTAPELGMFDTCYLINNHSNVPTVSFTFRNNVTVPLDASGILYNVEFTKNCFAFTNTTDNFITFASLQQRTLEMVFDVANNKLGLRQNGCV